LSPHVKRSALCAYRIKSAVQAERKVVYYRRARDGDSDTRTECVICMAIQDNGQRAVWRGDAQRARRARQVVRKTARTNQRRPIQEAESAGAAARRVCAARAMKVARCRRVTAAAVWQRAMQEAAAGRGALHQSAQRHDSTQDIREVSSACSVRRVQAVCRCAVCAPSSHAPVAVR